MPTTTLAVQRVWTEREETSDPDVIAGQRVHAQQLTETYHLFGPAVATRPIVLAEAVLEFPHAEPPAAHIWLGKQRRWSQRSGPAYADKL